MTRRRSLLLGGTNDPSVFRITKGCSGELPSVLTKAPFVQWSMQVAEHLDSATIGRLRKQGKFLLRIYQTEIARDPTSRATEASRSNVIALQHTVRQMYGEAVAQDVANFHR